MHGSQTMISILLQLKLRR